MTILITLAVSIVTTLMTLWVKSYFIDRNHKNKLENEHVYAQKKKIKESISSIKTPFINSIENLNHRLWNLGKHSKKEWLDLNGQYIQEDKYYFYSSVYRFTSVVCWANKIENEVVYLDTTLSDDNDLEFLKFCKMINSLLCETSLFDDLKYNHENQIDHFYRHELIKQSNALLDEGESIISYSQFESELHTRIKSMKGICQFFDSLNYNEDRYRWVKLYCLHLVVICIQNSYGYDFQKTNNDKIKEIINIAKKHKDSEKILKSFAKVFYKFKLENNEEVKKVIKLIDSA